MFVRCVEQSDPRLESTTERRRCQICSVKGGLCGEALSCPRLLEYDLTAAEKVAVQQSVHALDMRMAAEVVGRRWKNNLDPVAVGLLERLDLAETMQIVDLGKLEDICCLVVVLVHSLDMCAEGLSRCVPCPASP